MLFAEGEQAATRGDTSLARARFVEAGECAASLQLWRSSIRCYRHALELDLGDRDVVRRIVDTPARARSANWLDYAYAGRSFGCRSARVVIGAGAAIECPAVGPVMSLAMPTSDRIVVHPLLEMPLAMAMIIIRRAMWPAPLQHRGDLRSLEVHVAHHEPLTLDELGDWQVLPPGAATHRSGHREPSP